MIGVGALLTDEFSRHDVVVGVKQTLRAVRKNQAESVFIASDAAPQLSEQLVKECGENNVPVHTIDTMKNLGSYAGIEVKAVACALLR